MQKAKRGFSILVVCALTLSVFCGSAQTARAAIIVDETVTDYSNPNNWLTKDPRGDKAVDIFYVYPTAYNKQSKDDPNYCTVDNAAMITGANGAFNRQATAFLPVGNIYAPYYRQADTLYLIGLKPEERDAAVDLIPAKDIKAAFYYYIDHYNNDRPFILAGHSQGSIVLLNLLTDLSNNRPEVYKRMVAAYAIGYSVTKDYLAKPENKQLKFATGPDDTGVIISYNTEGVGVKNNPLVLPNALSINPITWTLTEKAVSKEDNAGSITLITPTLCDTTPIKNLASAQVDTKKGVVICDSVDINKYSLPGLEPGIYHSFDYPFYFYNIRSNAMNRVNHYMINSNKVSFNDVSDTAWYADAVTFIAAYGITTGTSEGVFSPDMQLTRGQFMVMLLRAYGIAPVANPVDNFTDAGSTYYTGYLAAAKKLGISQGVGNNMFEPDKEITRQEMFTSLYNALQTVGKLPSSDTGKMLSDFTDASQIASWATDSISSLVKAGAIGGCAGLLNPLSATTRAEMAQVLYNLLWK